MILVYCINCHVKDAMTGTVKVGANGSIFAKADSLEVFFKPVM